MRSPVNAFALAFGVVYIGVGLLGFAVTGLNGFVGVTGDALLVFDLNPFHNLVHLGLGAILLVAWRTRVPGMASGVVLGVGTFLLLAAVLGFTGGLELIGIPGDAALAADNFLHLFGGLAAIVFGLLPERAASAA